MDTKGILKKSVGSVAFLFAAFGNFLFDIAPPGKTDSHFAIGIGSISMLFILLFISSIAKSKPREKMKKNWFCVSFFFFILAIASSLSYKIYLEKLTFPFPPEEKINNHIAGTIMTSSAKKFFEEHPLKTKSEIVAAFEGPAFIERVWTSASIRYSKFILTVNYVIVVLSIAIMIFTLTEGMLIEASNKK